MTPTTDPDRERQPPQVEEITRPKTGADVALVCIEQEKWGRHFGNWKQADGPK